MSAVLYLFPVPTQYLSELSGEGGFEEMAHIRKVSIVHRPIRIRLDSDLELFDNPFGTQVINHFAVDVVNSNLIE